MMSTQEQFWAIAKYCSQNYSVDVMDRVIKLLDSHENVIALYDLIQLKLPEDMFLDELGRTLT